MRVSVLVVSNEAVVVSLGLKRYVMLLSDVVKLASLERVRVEFEYEGSGLTLNSTDAVDDLVDLGVYPRDLAIDATELLFIAVSKKDSFACRCASNAL